MRVYLVLGCNGHIGNDGFLYCNSIRNPIMDLSKIPEENKLDAVSFLDETCGMFDEIIFDRNKISNIVSFLYKQYNAIVDDDLYMIQAFMQMHKVCGLYLTLMTKEDFNVRSKFTKE